LGAVASRSTLLRLVMTIPDPAAGIPRVRLPVRHHPGCGDRPPFKSLRSSASARPRPS
jgi:hypothetical protein